jgi:[ribosomal protein S18]-alanine N-acetyltransferase
LNVATQSTGARFSIREYRPTDFDVVWEIDQLCFPSGIAYSQMELSSFLNRRHAISLVAEPDFPVEAESVEASDGGSRSKIVGFVVAHAIRHKYGRILTLDILPEARRFGLGTTLMLACEDRLRSSGCTTVFLETAVNNEPALRLYRKLGYEVVNILPDYYASHSLDAFAMRKVL